MEQPYLFTLPPESKRKNFFKGVDRPIWTENKAKLIERYLYYFVMITKHGTYIDGFAGPQKPNKPEAWSAKLVLESEPYWFRKFFLFEKNARQVERLKNLKKASLSSSPQKRRIEIFVGDFNELIADFLEKNPIKEKEATFCLLDQRTFECHWKSVEILAHHKKTGHKIELFYFLPCSWIERAWSATKDTDILLKWWGREDWDILKSMRRYDRAVYLTERIKDEFKYNYVTPWPIYSRQSDGKVMYYMIHATDHDVAPGLMYRAYKKALTPKESPEQFIFEFDKWKSSG